ncbi:MAG TPA: CRTAC1 family protein, partial [Thermoanaerobaculia bacterium]|nr:CRTAC1 family protein [Thermoanaerobaculia bacterium]
EQGSALLRGDGRGGFEDVTATWGLGSGARAVAAFDFDLDGDLDLALFGGAYPEGAVLRSSLVPPLVPVAALPPLDATNARAVRVIDHDGDGDPDLVLAGDDGVRLLENLRQGRFALRSAQAGLGAAPPTVTVTSGDFDGDGRFDLALAAAPGLALYAGTGEGYRARTAPDAAPACRALAALDADFDGRLDLACGGPGGTVLLQTTEDGALQPVALPGPGEVDGLAATDLDGDGDLDLALSGPSGLTWLENLDGSRSGWLAVRLAGLPEGNGKNNRHGLGALLEITAGGAVQRREVDSPVTRFGLGELDRAERLRVVWTNGVPQNRLEVAADQLVVEEQVLKGSCPFLYAWTGERVEFVTDLLWNAPLGLPLAPGVWAPADPEELVRVDGAAPDARGRYRLTVTEELWEAAFFDHVRLWVVDHPRPVEVASTLKVIPGTTIEDRVVASRDLRPLAAAADGAGRDVTARLAARDEVYAGGFERLRYQGATRPWTLELDLGEAPAAPVRLHLDAWIFPADASLNLAIAQRPDLPPLPPRLEMETAAGWRTLVESMGFPAGKTKTMVVDTPALPPGVRKLRIVTSLWLGFDRVAWTTAPDDGAARVVARLDPATARLGFGGFSAVRRSAPNGPHRPDFARRTAASPWLPFPGRYTRYGDVRELLLAPDDRSVILAPGDEMTLEFDASALPPPAAGFVRTVFLESHGWDKDADRNTWRAERMEPLPFRAMRGYPDPSGASFPDDPFHRAYVRDWLTREVRPAAR